MVSDGNQFAVGQVPDGDVRSETARVDDVFRAGEFGHKPTGSFSVSS